MTKYLSIFIFTVVSFCTGYGQTYWKKETEEVIVLNAPFKQCHASSIVEALPGKVMVTFFGGDHEGHKEVSVWLAMQENNRWSLKNIADGKINDSLQLPCWNPVLFKVREGKLLLFYKVGARPSAWWGMVKTSLDDGKTWSVPEKLPDGILGAIKNKPVQLMDGTILCPSSKEENELWKVYIERSPDLGKTWQLIPVDTGSTFKVIQPALLSYPNNRLQIVCRSNQNKIVQAWSDDDGKTWGKFSTLHLANPNSGIDAVTLTNGRQMLVYNPAPGGKEWFNNREKLNVAVSEDGLSWKDVTVLENGTNEEFSYPAIIQTADGKIHITYTYNRKNIKHVVLAEQ